MSDDVEAALQRARVHLRQATLEGLEAAYALLEAALCSSGLAGTPGDSLVVNLQSTFEHLATALRENASFAFPKAIADPLASALEAEIKRWERRSQTDEDARPVLRAFLGLRELLWELGMRRAGEPAKARSTPKADPDTRAAPARERVQRFDVED